MGGAYFADTFFWIAVAHPRDAFHARAVTWQRTNPSARLVTTQEVPTEFLNWFAALGAEARHSAAELVDDLYADPSIQVLPQTAASFQAALAFYRARPDKEYRPCRLPIDAGYTVTRSDGRAHERSPLHSGRVYRRFP